MFVRVDFVLLVVFLRHVRGIKPMGTLSWGYRNDNVGNKLQIWWKRFLLLIWRIGVQACLLWSCINHNLFLATSLSSAKSIIDRSSIKISRTITIDTSTVPKCSHKGTWCWLARESLISTDTSTQWGTYVNLNWCYWSIRLLSLEVDFCQKIVIHSVRKPDYCFVRTRISAGHDITCRIVVW